MEHNRRAGLSKRKSELVAGISPAPGFIDGG